MFQEHHQSVKWFYPGQVLHSVGPDLYKNCLQRLSADNKKSSLARKELSVRGEILSDETRPM